MTDPDATAVKLAGTCTTNGFDTKSEVDGLSSWARDPKNNSRLRQITDWGQWHIDKVLQKAHQLKNRHEALAGVGDGF